jgi:hypothetical protein
MIVSLKVARIKTDSNGKIAFAKPIGLVIGIYCYFLKKNMSCQVFDPLRLGLRLGDVGLWLMGAEGRRLWFGECGSAERELI